jgi:hypothetical protein
VVTSNVEKHFACVFREVKREAAGSSGQMMTETAGSLVVMTEAAGSFGVMTEEEDVNE